MSTEPGWMVARPRVPFYLGNATGTRRNNPSMLLSFERPAFAGAGSRPPTTCSDVAEAGSAASVKRLFTVLENCTEATSAAIDKRRLKTGITGPA